MSKYKSLEHEIFTLLQTWNFRQMEMFLEDCIPFANMFDPAISPDWRNPDSFDDNSLTETVVRAAYLLSRIAERHAAMLCKVKIEHKNLFSRLEKMAARTDIEKSYIDTRGEIKKSNG